MRKRLPLFVGLFLGLFTVAIFWPVIENHFVDYDDHLYVVENPWVQQGLTLNGAAWAFHTSHASNWHPVTWLSHMLDCDLFDLFPGGHHLTNLLLHAANTVLLFLLLRKLTGALWRPALVAALFGWHPLHVESVAWVSERKDVLSTLFWILTTWAYVRYVEKPGWGRYAGALGFFALGLMSKPMLVTLPLTLLLLDYWPLGRLTQIGDANGEDQPPPELLLARWLKLAKEKLPFLGLSAALCIITVWAQHKGGALKSLDSTPISFRCANALSAYGSYLWKMIWPANLAAYYPLPAQPPFLAAVGVGLLLASVTVVLFCLRRRYPFLLVGWLWYLGTLVPVIGLIQVGSQAMADRYTYVPLIGIFVALAWSWAELGPNWPSVRALKLAAAGVALAMLACATGRQLSYWRDGATLFEHVVAVTRANHVSHAAYGIALASQGRSAEAIEQFSEALRLQPNYALAHVSLATELAERGKVTEAIPHFEEVLRLRPDDPGTYNNLGVLLAQQGQVPAAIDRFNAALRIKPDYLNARLNLALAFSKQGKTSEAIACYTTASQLQPLSPEPLDKLAWIMATHPDAQFRDGPSAVRLAQRAAQLCRRPLPEYLDTLGAAYAEAGQFQQAIATVEAALRSATNNRGKDLTLKIQNRLQLYRQGKPYRETE